LQGLAAGRVHQAAAQAVVRVTTQERATLKRLVHEHQVARWEGRLCRRCGKDMTSGHPAKKYCSTQCRRGAWLATDDGKAYRARRRRKADE
jgi:hypothetical protein